MKPLFDADEFAKSIRRRLADLNMSKKDAAAEMGVNASTLTRITADAKTPDIETALGYPGRAEMIHRDDMVVGRGAVEGV